MSEHARKRARAVLRGRDGGNAILLLDNLRYANLSGACLRGANLSRVNFNNANLNGALFSSESYGRYWLDRVNPLYPYLIPEADLSGANIEDAQFLKDADLRRVKGLTKEQLTICKTKGAIIDKDLVISVPLPPVAPSSPPQSNDTQASSAPSAHESTPPPDPDGSSITSSKPEPGS